MSRTIHDAGRDRGWDDELWEEVWERLVGPVERHGIAVAVLRRQRPSDPFELRVGAELARRWRRRALGLAVLYGLWTVFWSLLAWHDARSGDGLTSLLTPVCAGLGMIAVTACLALRRRWEDIAGGTWDDAADVALEKTVEAE